MASKMRFAVIGIGGFGSRRVRAVPESGGELVCLGDLNEKRVSEMAREFGCDYTKNYLDITKRNDIDVVINSTPNKFHSPITIAALNAGKHVICEKPLARNPAEARKMVDAAKKNKVFLKTGSNLRYFSNVKKAKELVDKRAIGKPLFVRGWIGHDGKRVLHSWNANPDIAGGGTLLDNGAHIIDLFRWFIGDFSSCAGRVDTLNLPIKVEDNGMGIYWTKDGRMASIQASWTEWSGYMYLEIYGPKGSVTIDNRGERTTGTGQWMVTSNTVYTTPDGTRQVFDYSSEKPQSYTLELKDFIKRVNKGQQPMASGYDGMKVVEMIHGAYESSRTGRIVKLA